MNFIQNLQKQHILFAKKRKGNEKIASLFVNIILSIKQHPVQALHQLP